MTDDDRGWLNAAAEVEFLDFEQSTIGLCVMQCILDETLPLQAALHMEALQTFMVVDMVFAVITCKYNYLI